MWIFLFNIIQIEAKVALPHVWFQLFTQHGAQILPPISTTQAMPRVWKYHYGLFASSIQAKCKKLRANNRLQ